VSTFGNKALIWWNYHTRDRAALLRFNTTPKDLQLKILEKWYPIDMMVGLGDDKYKYKIIKYVDHLTFYSIKVELISEGSLLNKMTSTRNPLSLFPDPMWEKQIKRQQKITRLV
jgi:hypothetical protein